MLDAMIRTRKIPGSYSDGEIAQIELDARKAGIDPPAYVRKRLRLPQVERGRPATKSNSSNGKK